MQAAAHGAIIAEDLPFPVVSRRPRQEPVVGPAVVRPHLALPGQLHRLHARLLRLHPRHPRIKAHGHGQRAGALVVPDHIRNGPGGEARGTLLKGRLRPLSALVCPVMA